MTAVLVAVLASMSGCGLANVTSSFGFAKAKKHTRHGVHAGVYRKSVRHNRQVAMRPHGSSNQARYAARVAPLLDVSAPVFTQAASQAASQGSNAGDTCNQYGDQITILDDQFEGVPHPYVWYSKAGWLHHNFAGIYHDMLGALQECQTAVSNGDDGALAASVSEMASASSQIRQADSYAHWLAHHG